MKQFLNENVTGIHGLAGSAVKLALLVIAAFLVSMPARASMISVYVGQAAAGSGDGSSCANQKAVSFFNTSANWGSGTSQIGPGTTVHVCGVITTQLTTQASGINGNPIIIQWESGASVQVCSSTGAFQMPGGSWIVVDLGGNSAAVVCPNNGDGLSQTISNVVGISDGFGSGMSNIEIRNGTIGPLYIKDGANFNNGNGTSANGIYLAGGTTNHFHDLTITDTARGILDAINGTSTNDEIDHNSISRSGAGIYYACSGGSCTSNNAKIHANDFTVGFNWGTAGDFTHMESIHIFSNGAGSSINNIFIYDNNTHGNWPVVGGTAAYFVEQAQAGTSNGTQSGYIFNNICTMTSGHPGDGCIFLSRNNNTFGVYNNVNDCISNISTTGMEFDANAGNVFDFKNNIVMNCSTQIYTPGSAGTLTGDKNIYFNVGSGGWNWHDTPLTFAAWKTQSGADANSASANPGLNSDYTIASTSSLAYQLGMNLTSLSITQLAITKPLKVGAGNSGVTGSVRSAAGNWAAGTYTVTVQVNAPSSLIVTSIQ